MGSLKILLVSSLALLLFSVASCLSIESVLHLLRREEATGGLCKKADTNGDGQLSATEIYNGAQKKPKKWHWEKEKENIEAMISIMDENGDGRVSIGVCEAMNSRDPAQFKVLSTAMFRTADKDRDGFLNHKELVPYFERQGVSAHDVKYIQQSADTNGDNKISLNEFRKAFSE